MASNVHSHQHLMGPPSWLGPTLSIDSGVATGWTGVNMSTPLLLEVAPEIDTNPTSFYRGKVRVEGSRSVSRPPL